VDLLAMHRLMLQQTLFKIWLMITALKLMSLTLLFMGYAPRALSNYDCGISRRWR
jgi:hypothetical protein